MVINVAEKLGTRYVIQAYVPEFKRVLSENPSATYDLCDCRLSYQASIALREFYGTHNLVNTKNETLNRYLKMNCERSKMNKDIEKIRLYPESYDVTDIHSYITSLKEGVVYEFRVDARIGLDWQLAFLCLLILTRPEITVDIGYINSDLCEFIRSVWLYKAEHHDIYLEVDGTNLIERRVVDGYVAVPYRNELSEDMYRETFKCYPVEFGMEYLYEKPEWEEVVNKCLKILTKKVQRPKSIKDFIETR